MKANILTMIVFTLCGCVGMEGVSGQAELKTAYFDGQVYAVESCLYSSAIKQNLSLVVDSPLPRGNHRFNLQDKNGENVAWLDVSNSGNQQTSVYIYYAPHAPNIKNAVASIISDCQNSLRG